MGECAQQQMHYLSCAIPELCFPGLSHGYKRTLSLPKQRHCMRCAAASWQCLVPAVPRTSTAGCISGRAIGYHPLKTAGQTS